MSPMITFRDTLRGWLNKSHIFLHFMTFNLNSNISFVNNQPTVDHCQIFSNVCLLVCVDAVVIYEHEQNNSEDDQGGSVCQQAKSWREDQSVA